MDRRAFVRTLPGIAAGIAAGGSVSSLAGCAGTLHLVPTEAGGTLVVPLSSLQGVDEALLQTASMERPIYLRRQEDDGFVALLARCTHRGCQPEPVGDRLICPCHGSEFSLDGEVLQGPAEAPLARFETSVSGGDLVIRTAWREG
jgi:cytochrome b6-f complex iron-sulfur subunit